MTYYKINDLFKLKKKDIYSTRTVLVFIQYF